MKDATDKILFAIYGVLGSILGLLIFMFAFGGWSFVFTGRPTTRWNGLAALIICCLLGGGWGLVSYMFKDREFASGNPPFFGHSAGALLFAKRLMIIATSLAGVYFIWQVARSI